MSIDATRSTWKLQEITAIQKIILLSLADRAGENGECWPSIKRIMADTNLERRAVIDNRNILMEKGYIVYTGEYKGRSGQIPVMRLTYINNREEPTTKYDESFTSACDAPVNISIKCTSASSAPVPVHLTHQSPVHMAHPESKRIEPTKEPNISCTQSRTISSTGAKLSPVVTAGAIIHPVVNRTCGKDGTTNTIYKPNTNTNTYITENHVADAQNINSNDFSIDTDYEYPETLYGLEAKKQKKASAPAFNPQDDNPYNIPKQMLKDWKTIRNAKKSPVTKTAWDRLLKELKICEENGINPIDAFEEMISKSWISLKYEYFKNQAISKKETTKKTSEEYDNNKFNLNDGIYSKRGF